LPSRPPHRSVREAFPHTLPRRRTLPYGEMARRLRPPASSGSVRHPVHVLCTSHDPFHVSQGGRWARSPLPRPALARRGRPASPALHQGPRTAVVPWRTDTAVCHAHGGAGRRCPAGVAVARAREDWGASALRLRADCLTPVRSAFAFPLVPPSLSSPRCDGESDPAGPRALPRGALFARWTPRRAPGAALLRDFPTGGG
jgi:hypothetical protein